MTMSAFASVGARVYPAVLRQPARASLSAVLAVHPKVRTKTCILFICWVYEMLASDKNVGVGLLDYTSCCTKDFFKLIFGGTNMLCAYLGHDIREYI